MQDESCKCPLGGWPWWYNSQTSHPTHKQCIQTAIINFPCYIDSKAKGKQQVIWNRPSKKTTKTLELNQEHGYLRTQSWINYNESKNTLYIYIYISENFYICNIHICKTWNRVYPPKRIEIVRPKHPIQPSSLQSLLTSLIASETWLATRHAPWVAIGLAPRRAVAWHRTLKGFAWTSIRLHGPHELLMHHESSCMSMLSLSKFMRRGFEPQSFSTRLYPITHACTHRSQADNRIIVTPLLASFSSQNSLSLQFWADFWRNELLCLQNQTLQKPPKGVSRHVNTTAANPPVKCLLDAATRLAHGAGASLTHTWREPCREGYEPKEKRRQRCEKDHH